MPAHFAILRTAKLKSLGNVSASLSHTYRTRETPNADPSRADQNEHSHATPAEVLQAFKERLPNKRRKDAVLGIEYFVSASPEWFKGRDRAFVDGYFAQSLAWLRERHGEENVVGWSIHCDESSPHLVAYVVPRDGDTLNAKKWLGGRAALSRMQSDFAEKVARHHELERGIEGSRAHHQSIKDFYAQIEKPGQHVIISPETVQPKVLKKGFLTSEYETPEMVAERLTASVQKAYTPAVEAAKLAASESRRADEMTLTAQTLSREKKEAQERLQALQKHLAPVLELETLAKQEFVQLVMHTQERVKAIKAEREKAAEREKLDQERQRRVDDLVRVERKTAGASCTFAQHALEAIQKAGGDASKVHWPTVEKAAVMESITQHRQQPKDVLAAIVKYSPGMVEPAQQEQARAFISTLAGKEIAAPKVGKQHDAPSLG